MGNKQLVSPSRQRFSTPVGFGLGFLSKEQSDNTRPSPYSADLASGDFYPLPRPKSPLNGRRFCNATLTKWLPGMFQTPGKVYSCTRGLFEGNVAYMFVLFCISEK
jgi:hypothetical protein